MSVYVSTYESGGGGDNATECVQLSESRYILAKYRLQQQESITRTQKSTVVEEYDVDGQIGPVFIPPNLQGGELHLNRETCCQLAWCLCVPCISTSLCWIRCCETIYECIGKYITEKEEESEMKCCTMNCCRL